MKTKTHIILSISIIFIALIGTFSLFANTETISVTLVNNCGKKVTIKVKQATGLVESAIDANIKRNFKVEVGSTINVNGKAVYTVQNIDNGKDIQLCK